MGGIFIKSAGEEYQGVKRGRVFRGFGKEYNVEKRERGSNIIFPIILKYIAVGKNIKWRRGEVNENFGEENIYLKKMGMGKNIKI